MKSRFNNIFLSRFVIIATIFAASANAEHTPCTAGKAHGRGLVDGMRAGRGLGLGQSSPDPVVLEFFISDTTCTYDAPGAAQLIKKFVAVEDEFGSFCETGELFVPCLNKTMTFHSKLVVTDCQFDDPTNGQLVFVKGYDCDSDTCEKCSDDLTLNAYQNLTTYVNEAVPYMPMYQCFGLYTKDLNVSPTVHQRFDANVSEAGVTKYWQTMKDHSCISSASAGGGDSSSPPCKNDKKFKFKGKTCHKIKKMKKKKRKKFCKKKKKKVSSYCPKACNACP